MKSLLVAVLLMLPAALFGFFNDPFTYPSARGMGMGDAFTAVADDENAVSYNPAGLADNGRLILALSGSLNNGGSMKQSSVETGLAVKNLGIRFASLQQIRPSGSDWGGYHDSYVVNNSSVAYGGYVDEKLKVGLGVNFYTLNRLDYGGSGGGNSWTLGLDWSFMDNYTLGISAKDLFSSCKDTYILQTGERTWLLNSIPFRVNVGISAAPFETHIFSFEIKNLFVPALNDVRPGMGRFAPEPEAHFGYEYSGIDLLTFRFGAFDDKYLGISAGLGLRLEELMIDAAVTGYVPGNKELDSPKFLASVAFGWW
jgi:hypothetical protein